MGLKISITPASMEATWGCNLIFFCNNGLEWKFLTINNIFEVLREISLEAKGGFFSESAMCFLDLQISKKDIPKNYPELEI